MTNRTVRIFTDGGVVSPGDLQQLARIARESGCQAIGLGSRLELFLSVEAEQWTAIEKKLAIGNLRFDSVENRYKNIVTSFVALDIFPSTPWLMTDTYLDVLEKFDYQPRLKINLTDPLQGLIPHFSGELNFVASTYPRHWHLYLQLPRFAKAGTSQRQSWPGLVDGDDIPALAKLIEEVYFGEFPATITELHDTVTSRFKGRFRQTTQELSLPVHPFPSFEGWNPIGTRYWLGLYRRSHTFPVAFIEALCELCIQNKIGKIGFTPWKSLLIKGVREKYRLSWEKLLGTHSINTRHSALELNWQLPDLDTTAMKLRDGLVRELDEKEMRTAGLSFAIRTSPLDESTSALIELENAGNPANEAYSIYHTHAFTANQPWELFAKNVSRPALVETLEKICQKYYAQIGVTPQAVAEEESIPTPVHYVHQCPSCLTVYDQTYGEPSIGIESGTAFADLPQSFVCDLCETPKSAFVVIEQETQLSR
ncbi:MAG: rubredoxin [Bacteroidota bacterium]